jgi:hypothetical protein
MTSASMTMSEASALTSCALVAELLKDEIERDGERGSWRAYDGVKATARTDVRCCAPVSMASRALMER